MAEIQIDKFHFKLDLSQPLYEQVVQQIRSSIAKGEISLGEKIPSVRELAQALKVNPNTVMRAYQELDRDGLTETRRGQGTFITTSDHIVQSIRKALANEAIDQFFQKLQSLGFSKNEIENLVREKGGQ